LREENKLHLPNYTTLYTIFPPKSDKVSDLGFIQKGTKRQTMRAYMTLINESFYHMVICMKKEEMGDGWNWLRTTSNGRLCNL
jgi:hypothetical protein